MKTLGENIKFYREAQHLSQREFAERIGTTQQRVSEWETDMVTPSFFYVARLIKVLDVTFDDLIEGIDIENN